MYTFIFVRIEEELKLDYSDVLFRPKRSTLKSRKDVNLKRTYRFRYSKNEWSGIPIMAANMDGVGVLGVAEKLSEYGMITCLTKQHDVKIISGHEHISKFRKDTLFHLGSIMPMNIGELGKKYYWSSKNGFVEIDHKVGSNPDNDVILSRKDIEPQDDKPIYIKKNKEMTSADIKMEQKELDVDILEDFKKEAEAAGFDSEFIKELI